MIRGNAVKIDLGKYAQSENFAPRTAARGATRLIYHDRHFQKLLGAKFLEFRC